MRHYKHQEESKEFQKFSTITKQNLPNSKRTIIPTYQPINSKENIHHKATSYYSYKFNTNNVGNDFIPNEEPKVLTKRKSAGRILQESNPPLNIRQLKPNLLHQKYIESSQINNIPGPEIMKRAEDKELRIDNISSNNNKKSIKYFSKNYYNNNTDNYNKDSRNKCYELRNNDIESFQRKVFRDYNSNIACLPGVTINDKEKTRTLFAANSRKNESHISLGNINKNENINNIKNKYDYNKKNVNIIPRPTSFSGKRVIRDRNKESNNFNRIINSKINRTGYLHSNGMSEFNDYSGINRSKHDKNKSQIIFG